MTIGEQSGKQYTVEWLDKPKALNEGEQIDEE